MLNVCGPVAQWIRHLTTNQGIPGSSPGRVGFLGKTVDIGFCSPRDMLGLCSIVLGYRRERVVDDGSVWCPQV